MGTLSLPVIGSENVVADPKILTALEKLNGVLDSTNEKVSGSAINLTGAGVIGWSTPKVIATEQTRESASFGTLTTADEVTGVVVPENGLLVVAYSALVKSSVSAAGRAAIFIGANQLKGAGVTIPEVQETGLTGTAFNTVISHAPGLVAVGGTSFVTTGQSLGNINQTYGGPCFIHRLAAGTYNVSVQFKATSGSVTAKERALYVGVSR